MNWTALGVVLALVAGAAIVWLALAQRLVASEEKTKERIEAERRRLDLLAEIGEDALASPESKKPAKLPPLPLRLPAADKGKAGDKGKDAGKKGAGKGAGKAH